MQQTITLPERGDALVLNRTRWASIHADRELSSSPNRIETNRFGEIIMTPPAGGPHCGRQENIQFELRTRLGGRALAECPISTIDGVRAADVGWYSADRYALVRGQLAFETAPEICVEVMSPRNTDDEMAYKRFLYFDAGAKECWVCDNEGRMSYYHASEPNEQTTKSKLCPDFPAEIED